MVRILVTNDDGIDAPGILPLAQAMTDHGEVVVIAPNREFSGASSAIGALFEHTPGVERRELAGIPTAWAVDGPPALAVFYAQLGAFGEPFDLVVSGINPGANVGRSVYHSGTIGACLTGRNSGWSGVAVSQSAEFGIMGQAWADVVAQQKWHVAAEVASTFVGGLIAELPNNPVVANLNVPNLEIDEIAGWTHSEVGVVGFGTRSSAVMVPDDERPGHFSVDVSWGRADALPAGTDLAAMADKQVSITYLSHLDAELRPDMGQPEAALSKLIQPLR